MRDIKKEPGREVLTFSSFFILVPNTLDPAPPFMQLNASFCSTLLAWWTPSLSYSGLQELSDLSIFLRIVKVPLRGRIDIMQLLSQFQEYSRWLVNWSQRVKSVDFPFQPLLWGCLHPRSIAQKLGAVWCSALFEYWGQLADSLIVLSAAALF